MINKKNDRIGYKPILNANGGITIIDEFMGIDYMPYSEKKLRKGKDNQTGNSIYKEIK